MTARQRPTDHVRPLPASVVGRGTSDGDPNPHLYAELDDAELQDDGYEEDE